MKNKIKQGDYIIIGGNKDENIVKWGELQDIGLATGYKVINNLNTGVIVDLENKLIPYDNIWKVFCNKNEYIKWLRKESDIQYYSKLDKKINNIKNKILFENYNNLLDMLNRNNYSGNLIMDKLIECDILDMNIEIQNNINFENNIFISKDNNYYLLESKIFDDNENNLIGMIDGYLQIMNKNFEKLNYYIDDVWSFSQWNNLND